MIPKPSRRRQIALIACHAAVFSLMAFFCALPARAQFIGYTSPQGVQQTLASALACTGVPQIFVPQNLGQTQHVITIVASAGTTFLQAEIDGIDNSGNLWRISDQLRTAQTLNNTSLVAYGYYPKIQISVECTAAATFTLNYSGTSTSFGPPVGSNQLGQIDKIIAKGAPANASRSDTIQAPFGNQGGTLNFLYSAAGPAGSSIQVNCVNASAGQDDVAQNIRLSTTSQTFSYRIPAKPCPLVTVVYTTGGASAATYNLEYVFNNPGFPSGLMSVPAVQLGVNALTEPAAGTSALSNIIDTRGVKEATLMAACTTGAWTINVQTYAEDDLTPLALVTPVTAIAAAANAILQIGTEANPAVNTGTLSAAALLRFPLPALAFSFTNAGGAGTCTARLFVNY